MMNLLLYVESRRTLAQLRAEVGKRDAGQPSLLAYPDELFEESRPEGEAQAAPGGDDRFEWPVTPLLAFAF